MTAPEWSVSDAASAHPALASLDPSLASLDPARTPVDEDLIDLAAELPPGKALDLGCGSGQNALWLAERDWAVTAVDIAPEALDEACAAARGATPSAPDGRLRIVFELADVTAWRPVSRYDLVISTFALPPRGMGRSRLLEMAAAAVAPGGSILVRELDTALSREGRMAERYLVSREEIERHLDGFRIVRSRTRLASRPHGFEEIVMPVATVVATRRTDLRSL
jgi:trans-aconitate methyltransferase